MSKANIAISKGTTQSYNLTFTDSDGEELDITGATVYMTAKDSLSDADTDALFKKTVTSHTTPASGLTTVTVEPTDTSSADYQTTYFYDIVLKTAGNAIYRVLEGELNITYGVTNDTD
jgi:hypothetical protein